ncbi:argininosuccinate lyase-like [Saccoglossus kowalevskii]|uniref:Argininosuccinate lyase-like n=1 Tax=Saccoglossus kowalevskii TaxID=10224 RepID=A0ABM0GWE0_SACKO|nr:PREDICTED: argininosuccinate lyase-like [Saccoglossus kowalevskii]
MSGLVSHIFPTGVLQVATGVLSTLQINEQAALDALSPDMLATDIAYYLVRKGIPFREAHGMSGSAVHLAETNNCSVKDLTLEHMKTISPVFEADIANVWNYENSVEQYSSAGGTSKQSVIQQVEQLEEWLSSV